VYRAICKQYQEEVAVKLLDLENMNCSLDEIVREAQVGAGWWCYSGRRA
jgi:serine/threonine-protein kinase OSR1/STK39